MLFRSGHFCRHISDQDIFTDMFFRSEGHFHRHIFQIRRTFFTDRFFRPEGHFHRHIFQIRRTLRPEGHFSHAHFSKPEPGHSQLWPNGPTFSCTPASMGSTPSPLCLVLQTHEHFTEQASRHLSNCSFP